MKSCQLLLLLVTLSAPSALAQTAQPYVDTDGLRTANGRPVHDVTSGSVTFHNEREVTIVGLTYDGLGPGTSRVNVYLYKHLDFSLVQAHESRRVTV